MILMDDKDKAVEKDEFGYPVERPGAESDEG